MSLSVREATGVGVADGTSNVGVRAGRVHVAEGACVDVEVGEKPGVGDVVGEV
jgi:hypothetical protein